MIDILNKVIQDGVDRGLLQKSTSDDALNSSTLSIDSKQLVNFGSCSYMGLEYDGRLKKATKKTVDLFGTQFSTSRTYLSIGLYDTLETELSNMFGKPAIVSASTTLGHLDLISFYKSAFIFILNSLQGLNHTHHQIIINRMIKSR